LRVLSQHSLLQMSLSCVIKACDESADIRGMNPLVQLQQATHITQINSQLAEGGGGNNAAFDMEPSDKEETAAQQALPVNPFQATGTPTLNVAAFQLQGLNGDLNDGLEALLPNPVTRCKLAYPRQQQRVKTLTCLCQTLTLLNAPAVNSPALTTMQNRLNRQLTQAQHQLQLTQSTLNAAVGQQTGQWLPAVLSVFNRQPVEKMPPMAMLVAYLPQLWALAQHPDEQAALLFALQRYEAGATNTKRPNNLQSLVVDRVANWFTH
jgi:hypothetical protein